jgi:hypothetical protein
VSGIAPDRFTDHLFTQLIKPSVPTIIAKLCDHAYRGRHLEAENSSMRILVALSVAVAFGLFLVIAGGVAASEPQSPISKPLVALSGVDSHVTNPSYKRVATPRDWARVWSRHVGELADEGYEPAMYVDFDRCVVVAIFRGDKRQIDSLRVHSVTENAFEVMIRLNELGYGIALRQGEKLPPPVRPYAFVVLPKTDKLIVLEESHPVKGPRNADSRWEEWARLK